YENIGTVDNQGFTVSAGYQLESVAATISYSRAEPELNGVPLNDGNMNIGTATGDTLVTTVNYFATDDLEFGWTGRFVDRLTDVPDGTDEKIGLWRTRFVRTVDANQRRRSCVDSVGEERV
ncbi:hypothetical protein P4S70_09290, partial [Enterovibrio sp. Hal110]